MSTTNRVSNNVVIVIDMLFYADEKTRESSIGFNYSIILFQLVVMRIMLVACFIPFWYSNSKPKRVEMGFNQLSSIMQMAMF